MRPTASLSKKLMVVGASLLVVALISIGLTVWVTWQLEGGAAAVNEAGRMRMQAWRLASSVQTQERAPNIQGLVTQFDQSLSLLRRGDASRPLFVPWDALLRERFVQVDRIWQTQRPHWLQVSSQMPAGSSQDVDELVAAIDHFVLAIEQHLARLTAILNLFQLAMMALAIAAAVIMLYTGYLYVISPLSRLQQGLSQVESGEFSARIEVDTEDEFGQVAAGFNRMAAKLDSLYKGLETQVEAKTRHIEAQRMRLEALYEVSAFLGQTNNIEALARGFAQRVRTLMKADAGTVRWSDDASQRYLMLASDCFPQDMLEEERSLLAGACACGSLQADSRTRVIPILNHDHMPVRRCAKVGYESVVSVPIRLQERVLGEFNLFFRSPIHLSEEETELLDALASHLASALEGLRAAALSRESAVAKERTLLARELHDSIAQSLVFLKIQLQLLRNAFQKGQTAQVEQALDELDTGLRESIGDVRELLVHFRTRTNTDDIGQALQETLHKFRHQTGLPTDLQFHGEGLPLPPDVQVQVLHVLQEALSNVRKHASASRVAIEVFKGQHWQFVVRDDGVGFDTLEGMSPSHVGLKIMRERAAGIGATLAIDAVPALGVTVTLTLPPHPLVRGTSAQAAQEDTSPGSDDAVRRLPESMRVS